MSEPAKLHEYAETAMPIIDEMMENPETALDKGVINLIDFVILLSMRGYVEAGLPTEREQRERYEKLDAYIKELTEPAKRTMNHCGRLHIFSVDYSSQYLKEATAALEREARRSINI